MPFMEFSANQELVNCCNEEKKWQKKKRKEKKMKNYSHGIQIKPKPNWAESNQNQFFLPNFIFSSFFDQKVQKAVWFFKKFLKPKNNSKIGIVSRNQFETSFRNQLEIEFRNQIEIESRNQLETSFKYQLETSFRNQLETRVFPFKTLRN